MGPFFLRKILFFCGALGLGLTCLGLEPALQTHIGQKTREGREVQDF